MAKKRKKMPLKIKKYLAALKRARSLGYKNPKGEWHDILKRRHGI